MTDYNLAGLSTRSFEQLIQAIALKLVSFGVVVFGDGPDGGREATFNGLTRYPSEDHPWNGYIVIQAKFRQRPQNSQEDGEWALKQLKSELKDFANSEKRRRQPDYYIFATNVVLTPVQDKGTKDKADDIFQEFKDSVPLKGYDIWDYGKIRVFLDNFEEIRRAYASFITPGDVLSQIMDFIEPRKELFADQYINSEDIEVLVQKVRSHFDKTIQNECETLCSFNLLYSPMQGNLSQIYVQTTLNESQRFSSEEFSQERRLWEEVVRRNPKLMVLGKPGAGKTTLLQYIAVHCDEVDFQPKLIPVFISLKTLAENAKSTDEISLMGYIRKKYCRSHVSEQELKVLLDNGIFLFLLDGLDEVTEDKIRAVVKEIHQLVDEYGDNRVIVTCRKEHQAYKSKGFGDFTLCKVADFEQLQIDRFINNWFTESQEGTQINKEVLAINLITKLKLEENKRIRELADTPLLLHLICLIFQEGGDLPAKRVNIYKEGIDLLFEKWNQFNARVHLDMSELRKALRRIAAITFEKGKSYFEEDEILALIENSPRTLSDIEFLSGLLLKTNWRIYFFSHQIFQEYLTAEEFVDSQLIYSNLFNHVDDKRWREVFLLASALMQSADEFLWIMKDKINLLLQSENKLQIFLDWVYKKSSNIILNPVKARLFYISLYVDFFIDAEMNKLSEFEIENLESESSSYIYLANELGLKLELNLNCVINDAVTLFSVFNGILEYELDYDEVDNTTLCLSQDVDSIIELDIDPRFKQSLQKLKEQLPDSMDTWEIYYQEWWQVEGQSWIEKMRAATIKYSNIGYDWQFSDKQKKLLKQYYDANKLLLDCLNNGCNVSPEVRALIEDNLFLPLDSSPS